MKKSIAILMILLCGLFLFAGCGDTAAPEQSSQPEETAEVTDSGNGEETVFFGLNETVTKDDFCEMSDLYVEVLDDKAIEEGWYYYYTDTDESPAPVINWELKDEEYTTVEVIFTAKNISDDPQTFQDKIIAQMFYQEDEQADTVYFDGTVFQQNPGQVEESGEIIMWSTKPVEIEPGESANVSFRFNIPKDVYDNVYKQAAGEDTGIIETCEFNFGDGTTFVVDLAETLVPASEYEF